MLILTPIFFLFGILVFNHTIAKKKKHKKVSIKKLYKSNRKKFYIVCISGMLCVGLFAKTALILFGSLFFIGFLSIFVVVGLKILLKAAYIRLVTIIKGLLTGKLGVIIFPFYVPFSLLFLFAGFIFTAMPLVMIMVFSIPLIFNQEINEMLPSFEPIYILYIILAFFLISFLITFFVAIYKIKNSRKESFGFSFFKNDIKLKGGFSGSSSFGGGRSYSSSGYSSSSSSSSFSGGGGSSGGGGASGSW